MASNRETVISVISTAADQRIVLALRENGEKPVVLRSESFSANVGWFTQQVLEMTRPELSGLKSVLGVQLPKACRPAVGCAESGPQLLSFADAVAKRA